MSAEIEPPVAPATRIATGSALASRPVRGSRSSRGGDKARGASRLSIGIVYAFLAVIFLWPFPYQRSLNNPNEYVRVYTTMAMVEHKTFAIDAYFARFGATMDVAAHVDKRDGVEHTYSVKGPGTSFLGVPVYAAYRFVAQKLHAYPGDDAPTAAHEIWLRRTTWALRFVTVQLPSLLFLLCFERFLRRFSRDAVLRVAAVVGAGVGTNYLAYALMYVSHTQIAIAAFGAWMLLYVERVRDLQGARVRLWRLFAAGLLTGACTSFEYQGVICTAILSVYALGIVFDPRAASDEGRGPTLAFRAKAMLARGVPFAIGIAINAAAIMYFQWRCFGSPWTPGHKLSVNAASSAGHAKGLYGITAPRLDALGAMLTDPGYGLFGTAPLLAIGCIGLGLALRMKVDLDDAAPASSSSRGSMRGAFVAASAMCVVYALVLSGMAGWRGGWTIGPRYLTIHPPFLALGAVIALELFARTSDVARAIARAIAVGLAAGGVVSLGVISVLYNTLPEDISRPFSQIALTMLRGGLAPYSVASTWGNLSAKALYLVWWSMGLLFLWMLLPRREGRTWTLRVALTLLIGALAITPSLLEGDAPAAHAQKASLLGAGRFEPAGGTDEATVIAKTIEARVHAGGPDADVVESFRMCRLMTDEAQDNAARYWCDRSRSLGLEPLPQP